MILAELRQKWEARAAEWRTLGVHVTGEGIAREILNDIAAIEATSDQELFTPTEAATKTNYHPESIARLVRTGKVPNHGTKHRPRVKLAELPKKATRSTRRRGVAKAPRSGSSSDVVSIDSVVRDALASRLGRA